MPWIYETLPQMALVGAPGWFPIQIARFRFRLVSSTFIVGPNERSSNQQTKALGNEHLRNPMSCICELHEGFTGEWMINVYIAEHPKGSQEGMGSGFNFSRFCFGTHTVRLVLRPMWPRRKMAGDTISIFGGDFMPIQRPVPQWTLLKVKLVF